MKQLTREEAAAMVMGVLVAVRCPMPRGYGGWSQVMADLACVEAETITNMACDGRKTLKKKDPNR